MNHQIPASAKFKILPGQYYDQETGLHYNMFRDYDPGTGRYIESDPIGLSGGINIFGYVLQNPVKYKDPTGLIPVADKPLPLFFASSTIVCDGNGGIKIVNKMNNKCLKDCVQKHEEVHKEDALRQRSNVCEGVLPNYVVRWNKAECEATEIKGGETEVACLKAKLGGSKNCDCEKDIKDRIIQMTGYKGDCS